MKLLLKIHRWLIPEEHNVGSSAYILLVYLAIFFFSFYFDPVHGVKLIAVIIAIICFLVCYFRAYWSSGKQLLFYIGAICFIGAAMAEINWGASVFFVYAAAFSSSFESRRNAFIVLAGVILFVALDTLLTDKSAFFWIPALVFSAIVGILNIQQEEVYRKNSALKQSQQEIKLLAETAERERISRDLHDLLGHSLSVITLKSELAAKMIDKGVELSAIKQEIKAVEELSRDTLAQVRGAVKGYNQATIEGELAQARVACDAANIELIADVEAVILPVEIESELALIIREAITNVVRHAETDKAWVKLKLDEQRLILTISDQGKIESGREHSGMQNMRSRITKKGGEMTIENSPHTTIKFVLPTNFDIRIKKVSPGRC